MESKNRFSGLPFFIFITLVLLTAGSMAFNELLRAALTGPLVLFVAVYSLHIALYWLYRKLEEMRYVHIIFNTLQVLVLLAIFFILRGLPSAATVIGSMTMALIGQAVGFLGNTRRAVVVGLLFAVLGLVLFYFIVAPGQYFGSVINLMVNASFFVILMVLFNQQLAEREKATELAEQLESTNTKLTAYAAKIEQLTLQNERQRMARELHDTLAQGVAGLSLQLEAVKMHLQAGRTERAAAIVDQALVRAHSTLAESRAAIDNLRAEHENVAEDAREMVERFTQATGIPCACDLQVADNRLPSEITAHALRVLNEALINIARHAEATQAAVKFLIIQQQLQLEIWDNGKGFDMTVDAGAGHYGLVGMRERARLIGGALTVQSAPKHGTTIRFTVPGE